MVRGFLFIAAALVGWLASYVSGAWPWLGYASMTRSNIGVGPITVIGESRRGLDLGPETFLFFQGQEIVIEYDAEIRRGSLLFYVFQPFDGKLGSGDSLYVTKSGKGEWTVPVEKTAIYHITVDSSPTHGEGRGWDISYTVKWGARTMRQPAPVRSAKEKDLRVSVR